MTTSDAARLLAERSCREQGIPVPITDPVPLGRVADLLTHRRTLAPLKASVRSNRVTTTTDLPAA